LMAGDRHDACFAIRVHWYLLTYFKTYLPGLANRNQIDRHRKSKHCRHHCTAMARSRACLEGRENPGGTGGLGQADDRVSSRCGPKVPSVAHRPRPTPHKSGRRVGGRQRDLAGLISQNTVWGPFRFDNPPGGQRARIAPQDGNAEGMRGNAGQTELLRFSREPSQPEVRLQSKCGLTAQKPGDRSNAAAPPGTGAAEIRKSSLCPTCPHVPSK